MAPPSTFVHPKNRKGLYDVADQAYLAAVAANAQILEELVPIRIDLDVDEIHIHDTFTYNKNETLITPEVFAELLCDDLDLKNPMAVQRIAASMRQQIAAYGELQSMEGAVDQRVIIKLDVLVRNEKLTDTFEWDIAQPQNSPEEFTNHLCRELQIAGEYRPSIAFSIHDQIAHFRRTQSYDKMRPKMHPLRNGNKNKAFTPKIEIITAEDLEKKLKDSIRTSRRNRRFQSTPYGKY